MDIVCLGPFGSRLRLEQTTLWLATTTATATMTGNRMTMPVHCPVTSASR